MTGSGQGGPAVELVGECGAAGVLHRARGLLRRLAVEITDHDCGPCPGEAQACGASDP
jgi:hypothetical protein